MRAVILVLAACHSAAPAFACRYPAGPPDAGVAEAHALRAMTRQTWPSTILSWPHGDVIESAILAHDAEPETIAAGLACEDPR